jgi:soluble lytic murein transglycosylase-like protein
MDENATGKESMNRAQAAVFPAALLGSLVVACLGWMAAANLVNVPALQPVVAFAQSGPSQAQMETAPSAANEDRAAADSIAACPLSARYPEEVRRWCDLITANARQNGLDPNLVAAVILQESGGHPDAYSKSGAVGLMQVMPRDGLAAGFICPNGPCFASRPTIDELMDPAYNVAYGTRMLAGLIGKYGDLREALRYYGPKDMGYDYADLILKIFEAYQ